jgi:hypothetical protein
MPDHTIINIGCQTPKEMKDSFQLLGNWTIAKRASYDTITIRYVVIVIDFGFTILAWDCWRWLPIETKEEILNSFIVESDLIVALRS